MIIGHYCFNNKYPENKQNERANARSFCYFRKKPILHSFHINGKYNSLGGAISLTSPLQTTESQVPLSGHAVENTILV